MTPQTCEEFASPATMEAAELPRLFDALHARGYTVVGPTARDGAIVVAELETADDLRPGLARLRDHPGERPGAGRRVRGVRRRDPLRRGKTVRPGGPDLAMRAAMPVVLPVAYVVEEGFALADLRRIAASVGAAGTDFRP